MVMKNRKRAVRLPRVIVSFTPDSLKRFYETLLSIRIDRIRVYLNMLVWFTLFTSAVQAQTVLTGGKQKTHPTATGGNNNEATVTLVNATGHDMWDLRIILKDGKFKTYDLQGKNGKLGGGDGQSATNSVHVKFGKPVNSTPPNNTIKVTFKSSAPNYDPGDSITVIPTDTLGADLMVDRTLNPVQTITNANHPRKVTEPVKLNGGKSTVTTDGSNFPSIDAKNGTGQDVCDLRIENAKDKNGNAVNVDSVFVNDKKCTGTGLGGGKPHVFFPCVSDGSTMKITIKFHGTTEVATYDLIPTNKDSVNIGSPPVKLDSSKTSNSSGSSLKVGKGVKITGGSPGGKVSFTLENATGQNIHDLIVQAFDNKKKPVKIKKVKVNGNEWPMGGQTNADSTVVHADKGNNPSIPDGSKPAVEVDAKDPKVKIDSIHITPTDTLHNIIQVCFYNQGLKSLLIPNAYSGIGLAGRSGSLVMINESCSPISQLVFHSPDSGIHVESASSTSPYLFDSILSSLFFTPPIAVGQQLDIRFTLNALCPADTSDPTPYTTLEFFAPGSQPFDGYGWWYNSSCPAAANGSIDFTMTEGTAPFSFLWSNGATSEDIQNLLPGTYTLTVTSPSGCMMKTFEIGVSAPQPLVLVTSSPSCSGSPDGMIEWFRNPVQEHDPVIQQTFWIFNLPTNRHEGLPAGNYPVMVNDNYGCMNAGTVNLNNPLPVMVGGAVTNASCNGSYTGAINITAAGGNGSYAYLWNSGNTNEDRTSIKAGNYTVNVKDGLGCMASQTFTVGQPAAISISFNKTNVLCGGTNTGKLTANATGGVSPYQYAWSNGATTKTAKNLPAGTYTVTISDSNGCTKTKSTTLSENPPMMVMVNQAGPDAAIANVAGGVPPYLFQWNTIPVQTTPLATGLLPGQVITLTVTDAVQCTKSVTFTFGTMRQLHEDAPAGMELDVYPNPVSNTLHISVEVRNSETCTLSLMDAAGRCVYQEEVQNAEGSVHQLDVRSLAPGMYTLQAVQGETLGMKKVVIFHQ